jgi:hypothetical protein
LEHGKAFFNYYRKEKKKSGRLISSVIYSSW